MMNVIETILMILVSLGVEFTFVPDARVTVYVPEEGGINCMEPCDRTAYGIPLDYGVTVACGPGLPYNTLVYVEGNGLFRCQDHGGAIDDDEIDIAATPETKWKYRTGELGVVWIHADEGEVGDRAELQRSKRDAGPRREGTVVLRRWEPQ